MRVFTRLRAVFVVAATATFAAILGPAAAHAVTVDAVCVGDSHGTYDPGLTLTSQSVVFENDVEYADCESTDPSITDGNNHFGPVTITASCLTLIGSGSASRVIVWNTSETSTFSFDYVYSQSGGQGIVVQTGTITAGKFAGSDAISTFTGGSINLLDCLGSGITDLTSTVTLTITH